VARRELSFRLGSKSRAVIVKIGRAVRQPKASDGDPWWTPLEVRGLGGVDSTSIAGEDSLQSLVLALRFLDSTLPAEARRLGGRLEWLGERWRPILGPSRLPRARTAASKRGLKRRPAWD
jgi:hypothetical protein